MKLTRGTDHIAKFARNSVAGFVGFLLAPQAHRRDPASNAIARHPPLGIRALPASGVLTAPLPFCVLSQTQTPTPFLWDGMQISGRHGEQQAFSS